MGFECYRIGDLLLDAGTQEVTRSGAIIPVPRLSFKLLLTLARHAPNVVSTEQLEEEVWAGLVVDRGTVNKRVLLLRKALGEKEGEEPYIAVVRGSGYRLVVPVESIDREAGIEDVAAESVAETAPAKNSLLKRPLVQLLLLIAVSMSLIHVFNVIPSENSVPDNVVDAVTEAQLPGINYARTSVAVLPFTDISEGKEHQYLGDGIAEEVINRLAATDGLEVAARTSSFALRGTTLTAQEIAPRLRVGSILEGSIRHSDERIRVTAQLIDAQTGYHIWSQVYDRSFEEMFAVQDDIALNIARKLKMTLGESRQEKVSRATTSDMEAFSLYLKGRELFNNRIHLRTEGLREALGYFSLAAARDPDFARAYADSALVYWLLTSYDSSLDKEEYFEKAEANANFALELDPRSVDALGTLASVNAARGEIERAYALFERIHQIGSNDSNIVHWEAMLRIRLGYFDELIGPLSDVYHLDPYNEHIGWSLATALNFAGQPAMASDILQNLEHFTYRQYVLGLSALNAGDYDMARELLRGAQMRSGVLPENFADLLIDALQDPARADDAARRVIEAVADGTLADVVAFETLLILGSPDVFDLNLDPKTDIVRTQIHAQVWNNWAVEVRRDPRFKQWVNELGYVDFWRKHGWPDRCKPVSPDDFECI